MKRTKLKIVFGLLLYACLLMSCVSSSEVVASNATFMMSFDRQIPPKYKNNVDKYNKRLTKYNHKIERCIKRHAYLKDKEKMPDRYYFRIKGVNTPLFCVKNPEDDYFYLGVDSCKYILPVAIYGPHLRFKVFSDWEKLISFSQKHRIFRSRKVISGDILILVDSNKNIIAINEELCGCFFKSDGSLDDCADFEKQLYYIKANGELEIEQL